MEFTEAWNDSCSSVGLAARSGKIKELKRLICQHRPVDVADNRGWRPLHEASASAKNLKCMEELLKHEKTDVNWQTHEGETALLLACKHRRTDALQAVQLLVCRGANVNIADNENETPLLAATRGQLCEVVLALLNTRQVDTNVGDCSGWRPLHEAAMHGHFELVQALLAARAELDVKDECSMTPLFSAAQYGSVECLRILLEVAKERGQLHLVNSGAQDWATPLMIAAQQGFIDCVQLLLSYGADPNAHAVDNVTALHLAVQGKHEEMLRLLLQVMDVDILKQKCVLPTEVHPMPEMINPLHLAVEWESYSCLQLLLDAGFEVDSVFTRSELRHEDRLIVALSHLETPLSLALNKGDTEAANILLKSGASVNSCAQHVLPPMYSAILNGSPQHIDLLLDNGADMSLNSFLLVALMKPGNLCHLLRRGVDPRSCLTSIPLFVDAIFHIQSQELILRVLRLLLVFMGRDSKTRDFLHAALARSRDRFQNAHDSESWNLLFKSISTPPLLSSLCRSALRCHLYKTHRTNFIETMASLHLPLSLFMFLNHENLLSEN